MSEEPATYTVVQRPNAEQIRRAEAVESGIGLFVEGRARASGRKLANEQAELVRRGEQARQREERREHARRWLVYHRNQAELHEGLAAEHRRKALDLIGRA